MWRHIFVSWASITDIRVNFAVALDFVVKVTMESFISIFLCFKVLLFGGKLFADWSWFFVYFIFYFISLKKFAANTDNAVIFWLVYVFMNFTFVFYVPWVLTYEYHSAFAHCFYSSVSSSPIFSAKLSPISITLEMKSTWHSEVFLFLIYNWSNPLEVQSDIPTMDVKVGSANVLWATALLKSNS